MLEFSRSFVLGPCFAAAVLLGANPALAELPSAPKPIEGSVVDTASAELIGTWEVALIQGDDDAATEKTLTISSTSSFSLHGGFLGMPFDEGQVRDTKGESVFFAISNDGAGPVYHSGRLASGVLKGQSYFSSRRLLMTWMGRRTKD